MTRALLLLSLFFAALAAPTVAQRNVQPFPKPVFAAKTIAIVNHTHTEAIEEGAVEALKRWGHFTIVDDPDTADIVVTFDKKGEHEGTSTQTTGDDGRPSSSYSMSFSSSILMKAALRGSTSPFFSMSTSQSKKKAGAECITDLQEAYISRP